MRRLLCATDLFPKSEPAVDRTGILAQQMGATVSLMHVVSPAASPRILEQSLVDALARIKSRGRPPLWRCGPLPNVIVRTGNPARLILDTITAEEPDLLIIGPHRRRGIVDALEGTIAQKALGAHRCPVLMVQNHVDGEYRKVLFAVDVAVESGGVVRTGEPLVTDSTHLTIVHAMEPHYGGLHLSSGTRVADIIRQAQYSRRVTSEGVRDLLRQESRDASRYDVVIGEGRPSQVIASAIERHNPDLLIMGTRGNGAVRRALLGSVANRLLAVVECDVLVVPHESLETSNVAMVDRRVIESSARR